MNGLDILNEAARRFNEDLQPMEKVPYPLDPDTSLASASSALDSLAFMTYVMVVEEVIKEMGVSINLSNGEALAAFETAGSLATYLDKEIVA